MARHEGFIEKFIGDAVVAIFGVPKTHEDDPIRAIRAAQEIHDLVKTMSPGIEGRVGRPLAMHSGINTGLVVAGESDSGKGSHGLLGDAINVASRLSGLAKSGEILVGREVGAKGGMGTALLSLAQLHSAKGRKDRARESILEAIGLFKQCDAQKYLKQAEEVLASLG